MTADELKIGDIFIQCNIGYECVYEKTRMTINLSNDPNFIEAKLIWTKYWWKYKTITDVHIDYAPNARWWFGKDHKVIRLNYY